MDYVQGCIREGQETYFWHVRTAKYVHPFMVIFWPTPLLRRKRGKDAFQCGKWQKLNSSAPVDKEKKALIQTEKERKLSIPDFSGAILSVVFRVKPTNVRAFVQLQFE